MCASSSASSPEGRGLDLPRYQSEHAAGMDLLAAIEQDLQLAPGERALVSTGVALAIPAGYEGQVRPRSGLAIREGITLLNAPGTIDADYRGTAETRRHQPRLGAGDDPARRAPRAAGGRPRRARRARARRRASRHPARRRRLRVDRPMSASASVPIVARARLGYARGADGERSTGGRPCGLRLFRCWRCSCSLPPRRPAAARTRRPPSAGSYILPPGSCAAATWSRGSRPSTSTASRSTSRNCCGPASTRCSPSGRCTASPASTSSTP